MWNLFEKEIPEDEFDTYKSGVEKFDKEMESSLFLNNVGSSMLLFILFSVVYGIVVAMSKIKGSDSV